MWSNHLILLNISLAFLFIFQTFKILYILQEIIRNIWMAHNHLSNINCCPLEENNMGILLSLEYVVYLPPKTVIVAVIIPR